MELDLTMLIIVVVSIGYIILVDWERSTASPFDSLPEHQTDEDENHNEGSPDDQR